MPIHDPLAEAMAAAGVKSPKRESPTGSDLDSYLRSSADEIGVPHDIAFRQFNQESGFKNSAVSPKGAKGIAQFMPATAQRYNVDVNDPISSIRGWKSYMGDLLKRYNGRMDLALAGYNAGEGNVDKFGGIPPFKETQDYVRKIMGGSSTSQKRGNDPLTQAMNAAGVQTKPQQQQSKSSSPVDIMSGASIGGDVNWGKANPEPAIEPPGLHKTSRDQYKPSLPERAMGNVVIPAIQYAGSSLTEGVLGGVSNTIKKAATGMESSGSPIGNVGALGMRQIADYVQRGASQLSAEHAPQGFIDTLAQSALRGAGSASVDLPQLFAGSPLGSMNLPLQMAASQAGEGPIGLLKGTAEGMVYHFGMGLTAPLGRVKNFLVWGSGATTQSAIEQKIQTGKVDLGEAFGSGLNMGAMSSMSPKVNLFDPQTGQARPARISDLVSIQRGTWSDGTPVKVIPPDYIQPYLAALKEPVNPDVLSSNKIKESQERINALKTQREAKFRMTQPLSNQAIEQLRDQLDPFQMKVVQSHLDTLEDEDKLWQVISIQNQLRRGIKPEKLEFNYSSSKSSTETDINELPADTKINLKPMEGDRYTPDFENDIPENLSLQPSPEIVNSLLAAAEDGRIPHKTAQVLINGGPEARTHLNSMPELDVLSQFGKSEILKGSEHGLELLAHAIAPKIGNSDYRISDHLLAFPQEKLEQIAKSPNMYRLAMRMGDVFNRIQLDLIKHDPNFGSLRFGGFDLNTGRYAANLGGFRDGARRVFVNIQNTLASIHALHQLDYIKGDQFSSAIAQHLTETLYHEFTHETDPIYEDVTHEGIEGHSKEFDARYQTILEKEADNVIKYKKIIQKALEEKNESITNEVGQQALDLGIIKRVDPRSPNRDSFVGDFKLRGKFSADTILGAASPRDGTQLGQDPIRLSTDKSGSEQLYPLYKPVVRDKLIEWAKKRQENLDRFMGDNSIFRKSNGSYDVVYRASTRQPEEMWGTKDIGPHFGTQKASNDALASMGRIKVVGDGYERMAGKKEINRGEPLNEGEKFEPRKGKPNTLPVYLKLENPVYLDDVGKWDDPIKIALELGWHEYITSEELVKLTDVITDNTGNKREVGLKYLRDLLKSKGFDGIEYRNNYEDSGMNSYIPFEPEQVKSAIGNSGEFDPHSPDMMNMVDPVSAAIKGAIDLGKLTYKAGKTFVDWSKEMIDHLGPGIKLHLENIWEAVVKMHQNEQGALDLGTAKFIHNDIAPMIKKSAIALNQGWDTILKHFAPAARGIEAKQMAGLLRENSSATWLKFFRAEAALRDARSILDKIPEKDAFEFIDHIENGRKQTDKSLQPLADVMRRLLDEGRYSVQRLGTGKLSSFYTDYFPHIWKDPDLARTTFQQLMGGKRPMAGKKSFLKQRTHITFADGIAAGLEPVSKNPVDLVMLKLHEVNKYVMGIKTMQEAKANGWVEFVKAGKIEHAKTQGLAEIDDTIATVYGGGAAKPQGGMLIRGKYMAPEQAARVINNYLSPGLRQNAAFRGYMTLANTMNQFQLGLSLFHAGFTTIDAMNSKLSLAAEYMTAGKPLKSLNQFIRANPITAPIENLYRGNKILQESLYPGTTNSAYAEIVRNLTAGGYRPRMEKIYLNDMVTKLQHEWKQGNYLGALIRSPFAGVELLAKPILEELVPRQKLGVAADLVRLELDKNPGMSIEDRRATMGKAWDTVDNRLGQMTYDNLFWNKTAKDLAMFGFRSVGWNLGSFREIAGGVYDTAGILNRATAKLAGKPNGDIVTHRMAYTMFALPVYTALLGALTQYFYTGKGPQELKDYFFPRTGQTDERGNPERVNLPTYMKDVYHYKSHPIKTLTSKIHPALSTIYDMLSNEDYYGTEIYNEDDSRGEKAKDIMKFVGKSFVPFGIQNLMKEKERGASTKKALIPMLTGITPAPADVNQTSAEEELYRYNQESRPRGTRTKLESARTQNMYQIRTALLNNKPDLAKTFTERGLNEGIITQNDLSEIVGDLSKSPIQKRFAPTNPEEAVKVWVLMNEQEKSEVQNLMRKKLENVMELPPARRDKLIPKYNQVIEYYTNRTNTK